MCEKMWISFRDVMVIEICASLFEIKSINGNWPWEVLNLFKNILENTRILSISY